MLSRQAGRYVGVNRLDDVDNWLFRPSVRPIALNTLLSPRKALFPEIETGDKITRAVCSTHFRETRTVLKPLSSEVVKLVERWGLDRSEKRRRQMD